jgi:DtxR family Mn-dependent transcriptional regulator
MELTAVERETLKAIYRLSPSGDQVRPGDLAEALNLSSATITARLKHLDEVGLAEHQPYLGVHLTRSGRRFAVDSIRTHRIVERFLADMLGYTWDQADSIAVTFEHDLPAEVVGRMFVALDRPEACPHGFPIPEPEADEVPVLPTLADVSAGEEVEVAMPGTTHPDVVAFLEEIGIRPGTVVTVREHHPFEGPVVLTVAGQERVLGHKMATGIYVSTRKGATR